MSHTSFRLWILSGLVASCLPAYAIAIPDHRDVTDALAKPATLAGIALTGAPAPERKDFWVTEAGLQMGDRDGAVDRRAQATMVIEYGYMRNVSPRVALGGVVHIEAVNDDDGRRFGLGVRQRTWLGRRTGLDLSLGVLTSGAERFGEDVASPELYGSVGLSHRFIGIAAEIRQDRVHDRVTGDVHSSSVPSFSIRAGSVPGMAVTLVGLLLINLATDFEL